MAKGICGLVPDSLGAGDVWPKLDSELKNAPPAADPVGRVEVGEGSTSVRRDGGSFLSEFQIPVPQDKGGGAGPRLRMLDDCACEVQVDVPGSPEGVLGCEAVGDIGLLAKEPFRGRASG